ncbi:MAG: alpha/beta fold hydrolase [Eubacteriales bacterium]|nr:alpha/beta fold hydrolase [Eubacteriales bacterium]
MFKSVELTVSGKTIRGTVMTPEGNGPFPTVCFYHGFSVDRIGMNRLHYLFSKRCVEEGFACVRFDFYGCGESDGDFREKRLSFEVEQSLAIYDWAIAQDFADPDKMFMVGHSLGGVLAGMCAPKRQPAGAVLWSPGLAAYYDISSRVHAVPTMYEKEYDIGGMLIDSEFLTDLRQTDILGESKGYDKGVLIIHGDMDEKVPVFVVGEYVDMYKDNADVHIVMGSNHQFSSWAWKQEVYDNTMEYLKKRV